MHIEVEYVGGADPNGYAQGQLHEVRVANINVKDDVISEDSPIGKELINSYVGKKFIPETLKPMRFRVLHVPLKNVK